MIPTNEFAPRVLTLEERNKASIERIKAIDEAIQQAESLDERFDLIDQRLDEIQRCNMRNSLALESPAPTVASKIGQAVVGWVKNIPSRMIHPG